MQDVKQHDLSGSTAESWIRPLPIPIGVLTDSYKATHYLMYPDAQEMVGARVC
jgi:hypothetical protein